jgi:hypothetical protein
MKWYYWHVNNGILGYGLIYSKVCAMGQDLSKIERTYDAIAEEWAKVFTGEHEKKPMDWEILTWFAREIKGKTPVWDFGCGTGTPPDS